MKPIPSEWLQPGAIVPVTPDVVRELLECVRVAYKAGQEAEREACAKVIDDLSLAHPGRADLTALQCAAAIRARGQA
jgi:hypothetical protein